MLPKLFLYQKEVYIVYHDFHTVYYILYFITPAPPTPTGITAWFVNASSVKVAWQWASSDPAPSCFNITTLTYHPEGGGESSLQLSDPVATEATLTDLQCNTNYTITVVATAGGYRRKSVAFRPSQGTLYGSDLLYICDHKEGVAFRPSQGILNG